jgi:hypothetical protein
VGQPIAFVYKAKHRHRPAIPNVVADLGGLAYELTSIADYGTRADAKSGEDTQFAIDGATRLLDGVTRSFR